LAQVTTRTVPGDGELEFDVVDVFTSTPYAGNGLAVVYGADSLNARQLQAMAREFHLSETAFPVDVAERGRRSDDDGADYRLRIFTPEAELPFAGHPSVGTAWALRRRGLLPSGRRHQLCLAGLVEVEVGEPDDLVWLTGRPPVVQEGPDAVATLAAVGLQPAHEAAPAVVAGAGLDFAYVGVTPDAVARAVPDLQRLRGLRGERPLGGLVVVAWRDGTAHVRVFADDIGVPEDPATGSAALGLGAALVHWKLLPPDGTSTFTVRQGAELGRPSTLHVEVRAEGGVAVRCRVGGCVVPVSRGAIRVPPDA
jgi:trans-2,3-dihydro-3-hydroxyanthranilate isomerase